MRQEMTEPYKILLIDDHPLMRKGMRQILELETDFVVVGEASNGSEGIAKALDLQPDLIILDLNMKGISGLDTLRSLRAHDVDARVVVLTVSDEQSDILALMDAGVDGYLLKDSDIINNLEIKTDNINFLTKKPDEIWNILHQAGCTFKEIEIQNRTLLDSIFVTTKDNGGEK